MNEFGMLKRFCGAWAIYWTLYVLQPVSSLYPGIVKAFLLQMLFVFTVAIFYILGASRVVVKQPTKHLFISPTDADHAKFIIKAGIFFSLIGLAFLIYDKIEVQGIDYSQGLALARQEWRVLGEERSSAASSLFSVIGYLLGGAYFLSLALSVSRTYPLTDRTRFSFIFVCLAILLLNSAITGGRSSILLALIFISFGYFSASKNGHRGLFDGVIYNRNFKILLAASGLYTLYIFYLRALASGQFVGIYSLYFLEYLGLTPYEWFAQIAYETSWGGGLALLNLAVSYLTHSITSTAAILQAPAQSGDVILVNFMQIASKFGILDQPQDWFLAGRFASLPGALYLQYGAIGLLLVAALLGFFSGLFSKMYTSQPNRVFIFFFCSICELILLMSPFLFAAEFLFFPSIVVGALLIIALSKFQRASNG